MCATSAQPLFFLFETGFYHVVQADWPGISLYRSGWPGRESYHGLCLSNAGFKSMHRKACPLVLKVKAMVLFFLRLCLGLGFYNALICRNYIVALSMTQNAASNLEISHLGIPWEKLTFGELFAESLHRIFCIYRISLLRRKIYFLLRFNKLLCSRTGQDSGFFLSFSFF